jgi:hypothetical protein
LATAFLASKATVEAVDLIRKEEEPRLHTHDIRSNRELWTDRTKLTWRLYVPTAISAATTVSCIIGANRIEAKKTLAAQTAFAFSQRAYSEYRDKVIEEYGERKDQNIRDSIAEERVKSNTPSKDILISGSGNVLCCEMYTMRYFSSDMETLRRAENALNKQLLAHDYATFDDFYHMVGLGRTSSSSQIGWESTKLMELQFTTVLTDDGRPCLAFEYNYTKPL